MIKKIRPKSEFSRNVLTLMTGTTIAQAVPIAISPILTRLYSPKDFGVFALFVSIVAIFGSIVGARYELAIMLPRKDEDAINIVALCLLLVSIMSFVMLFIVVVLNAQITNLLGNQEMSTWLYLTPVSVFLIGFFNTLKYYNNRIKNYKDIAKASIYKSLILVIVQIAVGVIKPGVTGLISGSLVSSFFANIKLLKNTVANNKLPLIKLLKIIALAKRYRDFPKYSMWATLINTLSNSLVDVLISILYNAATLGHYSLVQRVIGAPTLLIGSAIGQVFFEQAAKEEQQTGKAVKAFKSTVKKLLLIGIPTFLILFVTVGDLFALVFGEEWRVAGEYAQVLLPMMFIKFISSPLSSMLFIGNKQKINLYAQGIFIVSVFFAFILCDTIKDTLLFLSISFSLVYIYYFYVSARVAKVIS